MRYMSNQTCLLGVCTGRSARRSSQSCEEEADCEYEANDDYKALPPRVHHDETRADDGEVVVRASSRVEDCRWQEGLYHSEG